MSSGLLNPPQWDEKNKDFALWLCEVRAWELATEGVPGVKDNHALQLALHLPESGQIRFQIFDSIDRKNERRCLDKSHRSYWEILQKKVTTPQHSKREKVLKYNTKIGYKMWIKRFKMDVCKRIHRLNLLCRPGLTDTALRITMREVNNNEPEQMCKQPKKLLKQYFGSLADKLNFKGRSCVCKTGNILLKFRRISSLEKWLLKIKSETGFDSSVIEYDVPDVMWICCK